MRSRIPPLSHADMGTVASAINARNARTSNAADFVAAVVIAILLACALVHWATPCADAMLCAGPAGMLITPTRTGWLQRQWLRWQSARLRLAIRMAEGELRIHQLDLAIAQEELAHLPGYIAWQQHHLSRQRTELANAQAALRGGR